MIVELRLYHVKPGMRAEWIDFFERRFLPYHDDVGIGEVLGHFLSYRDDGGFVWLHGFRSRDDHARAQAALWGSERWEREFARTATSLLDETQVHLMEPTPGSEIQGLDDVPLRNPDRTGNRVLEVRIYRIRRGQRDEFAAFFHAETVAAQEASGMRVLGEFVDVNDEDCFVWLRGFPDLQTRDRTKAVFYGGELWLQHLEEKAFGMIEDYSNVWLVTPAADSRFQ